MEMLTLDMLDIDINYGCWMLTCDMDAAGMIDTGVDDKSCFLIDSSGNITTRTPADEYMNPITEPFRRKVIQYITWGDGVCTRSRNN